MPKRPADGTGCPPRVQDRHLHTGAVTTSVKHGSSRQLQASRTVKSMRLPIHTVHVFNITLTVLTHAHTQTTTHVRSPEDNL